MAIPPKKPKIKPRSVVTPQRRNGKARVAAVLQAAASLISERGYDATTMAEIAASARAPIGSLYRFFPNKETLADALIHRYVDLVNESFDAIDRQITQRPFEATADAILAATTQLHHESQAMVALLDARPNLSGKREEFRKFVLKRIATTLTLCSPTLPKREAKDIAVVVLQNMKSMKALTFGHQLPAASGAVKELRQMNHLYLVNRLNLTAAA